MNTELAAVIFIATFLIDFVCDENLPFLLLLLGVKKFASSYDRSVSVVVVLSNSYAIFRTWEGGIANLYRLT